MGVGGTTGVATSAGVGGTTSTSAGVGGSMVSTTTGVGQGGATTTTSTTTTTSGAGGTTSGTGGAPTLVGDVVFSPPSGTYEGTLAVELSSAVAGEIHYTTDGTEPTASSPIYEGALQLTVTTQVRAQMFANGVASGAASSAIYVARDFDTTSDLPLLIVDGYAGGKPTNKDVYQDAAFMLFEPAGGVAALSAAPTVATRAGYHVRGQSSASFDKTPYRIELWDNASNDADYPIVGMPAEADWGLIGPWVDRALIRNAFVYDLGRAMGLQAPRVAFVETYINNDSTVLTSGHYEGVYTIVELIKNSTNRLDLQQLRPDDTAPELLSGGYIFSFEYQAVEGPTIECTGDDVFFRGITGGLGNNPMEITDGFCWTDLEVRDPDEPNAEQEAWLSQYLHEFHDTLHQSPIGPYEDYIDVDSFVDQFIITEFTRDMDGYIRSSFFHKDLDGKLIAGPLWDYNLGLNAGGYFENMETEGWHLGFRRHTVDWFYALVNDPAFMDRVSARWKELRMGVMSDAELLARFDALAAPLANAAVRDFERWPPSSVNGLFEFPPGDTWQEQLDAIRTWMPQRAAWLDTAVDQPIVIPEYP